MKSTPQANLTVFHDSDLPSMASHCPQSKCGYSIYKGVLVQWDEDQDERILTFIDELPEFVRAQLLVAQEHEASLGLLWRGRVPQGYEDGAEFDIGDDIWHVAESKAPGA